MTTQSSKLERVKSLTRFLCLGSAIGNRREAIEALRFVARGLVKCHYTVEKLENLEEVGFPTMTSVTSSTQQTVNFYFVVDLQQN